MASNYIVTGSVGRFLREEFSGINRHMIEEAVDPVQKRIVLNTSAVRSSAAMGRPAAGTEANSGSQFEASHPVSFGRSGLIRYQSHATLLGNDSPPMLLKTTFPSALTVPQRSAAWLTIGLKWLTGNLVIDTRQLDALRKGNSVEDFLAKWLTDPYKILIQQLTNDLYGSGYGVLAQVKATTSAITAGSTGTVTVTRNVTPFYRGQRVTLWQNTSGLPNGTQRGSGVTCMVTAVHSFTTSPSITLQNLHASTAITPTITDHIVAEGAWDGTTAQAVLGFDYFTNNSTTIHGLSKSTNPELRSYVDSNSGTLRNPTPIIFQKAADAQSDRGFPTADLWVTSRGVRSLYYQQEAYFKQYNTDLSRPVQRGADGGNTGDMQYTTEEGVTEILVSRSCKKSTAYLVRLDALMRYAPDGLEAIQFLGDNELLGGQMFLPSMSSDQYSTVLEAPFSFWYENGCLEPQCLGRIDDLNELSDVA